MNLPSDFTITCHAGALGTKANTVDSVRTAVKWGAQIVEFDVTFRPSGLPVIIHSGSPSESEGELLSEALAAVAESDTCRINLDIKSTSNLPEVDRLVAEAGLTDRVFYTGVGEEWVETVRKKFGNPLLSQPPHHTEGGSEQKSRRAACRKGEVTRRNRDKFTFLNRDPRLC